MRGFRASPCCSGGPRRRPGSRPGVACRPAPGAGGSRASLAGRRVRATGRRSRRRRVPAAGDAVRRRQSRPRVRHRPRRAGLDRSSGDGDLRRPGRRHAPRRRPPLRRHPDELLVPGLGPRPGRPAGCPRPAGRHLGPSAAFRRPGRGRRLPRSRAAAFPRRSPRPPGRRRRPPAGDGAGRRRRPGRAGQGGRRAIRPAERGGGRLGSRRGGGGRVGRDGRSRRRGARGRGGVRADLGGDGGRPRRRGRSLAWYRCGRLAVHAGTGAGPGAGRPPAGRSGGRPRVDLRARGGDRRRCCHSRLRAP